MSIQELLQIQSDTKHANLCQTNETQAMTQSNALPKNKHAKVRSQMQITKSWNIISIFHKRITKSFFYESIEPLK